MLGEKIYELRKKSNLSQEQLAEKLNITRQTVSNWETNQTVPDAYQLKDLSNVFQVSADEILDNKKYETETTEKNNFIIQKTKEYLQDKFSKESYETWFEPIKLKDINKGIATLIVPDAVIAKYIKHNNYYHSILLESLNDFTSKKIREINFVVEEKMIKF